MHVIDSGGLYGAERILLALMQSLQSEGVDCSLASIAEPGLPEKALEAEARRHGLDVRRHKMASGPDRSATRRLIAEAERDGFDLFHTHGYKANTLIAGLTSQKRGLPAVATLHGWTAATIWSRIGIYEMVERFALRRAERVVAVSEAMVEKWGLDSRYVDRLRVIRNGIPVPSAQVVGYPLPESIRSFVAGRLSIFAAGRLSYEKGFDVLLDALATIRAEGVEACLVLVGEGRERDSLKAQARSLGIEQAVLMPGYMENARALMRHIDVVAIPSRTEGLPVVLLEALMSGIPVAATAVGEMPAVLQSCDAGRCAESGNAVSLADAIRVRVKNDGQVGASQHIATIAKRLYAAQAMASAYLDLYQELAPST